MTKSNISNYAGKYVSTSVLAKSIGVDRDELFNLLESFQLIVRTNKQWKLTKAGQDVGGIYKSYGKGTFIVWPLTILEHPKFAYFEAQNEISESHLHSGSMRADEYNASVTIPAYPTVDIDFADIKSSINQKIISFIAKSSTFTKSEVTKFLTQTVCNIGDNLGYEIEKEPPYHITDLADKDWIGAIGDVAWKKHSVRIVMWEIDSTNKARSIIKLMSAPAKYNVWLPWARRISRLHINCLLHRRDCRIIRPDHNIISDLWSKISQQLYSKQLPLKMSEKA